MTRGHLPSVAAEIAAVLERNGFAQINRAGIASLVEAHKEAFIGAIDDAITRVHDGQISWDCRSS